MQSPAQAPTQVGAHRFQWLGTGEALLEAKLAAIAEAKTSVRMETYIFKDEDIGKRFREALIQAGERGVQVKLLVDAIGGGSLSVDYFQALNDLEGCAMRWFNRPSLATWSFRDHRKILVIDGETTFVGGCNIAEEYHGDGVNEGWRDGGARVDGPVAEEMEREYDLQWAVAELKQWRVQLRIRLKKRQRKLPAHPEVIPLFVHPGLGESPLRDAMREDFKVARDIAITSAFFLPSENLRHQLSSAAGRGARVRILLGGQSDVKLMQAATRSTYGRLLDSGLEIWEYQPQIVHAKVLVLDDVVYIGSSNLDPRSLRINFEVMLRIASAELAATARAAFEADLRLSHQITQPALADFGWWTTLKQKAAHWLLGRVDPRLAEGMLRRLQNRA